MPFHRFISSSKSFTKKRDQERCRDTCTQPLARGIILERAVRFFTELEPKRTVSVYTSRSRQCLFVPLYVQQVRKQQTDNNSAPLPAETVTVDVNVVLLLTMSTAIKIEKKYYLVLIWFLFGSSNPILFYCHDTLRCKSAEKTVAEN